MPRGVKCLLPQQRHNAVAEHVLLYHCFTRMELSSPHDYRAHSDASKALPDWHRNAHERRAADWAVRRKVTAKKDPNNSTDERANLLHTQKADQPRPIPLVVGLLHSRPNRPIRIARIA